MSNAAQVAKLNEVDQGLPDLETIVVIDGEAASDRFRALTMADVLALGREQLASDPGAAAAYRGQPRGPSGRPTSQPSSTRPAPPATPRA